MTVTPGMAKRRELVVLDDGRVVRLLAVGMPDSLSPLPRRRRVAAGMVKVELPGGAIINRRAEQVVRPYEPGQNPGQNPVGHGASGLDGTGRSPASDQSSLDIIRPRRHNS